MWRQYPNSGIVAENVTNLRRQYVVLGLMDKRPLPETMDAYAAECRRLADLASDSEMRGMFLELADRWNELAALRRRIEADKLVNWRAW